MKTLKEFLEKNQACKNGFDFAKDLTLEQFLKTCERGDWILWLFVRMNPDSLCELTLAKGYCAKTVRELMKDQRSIKAVDVAIAFGEGKATRKELDAAADAAYAFAAADAAAAYDAAAAAAAAAAFAAAAAAAAAAFAAAAAAYDAAAADAAAGRAAARKQNQKQTADICKKYLPLEIWNQSKI
jgi:nucleoid-associated protein YgaU